MWRQHPVLIPMTSQTRPHLTRPKWRFLTYALKLTFMTSPEQQNRKEKRGFPGACTQEPITTFPTTDTQAQLTLFSSSTINVNLLTHMGRPNRVNSILCLHHSNKLQGISNLWNQKSGIELRTNSHYNGKVVTIQENHCTIFSAATCNLPLYLATYVGFVGSRSTIFPNSSSVSSPEFIHIFKSPVHSHSIPLLQR